MMLGYEHFVRLLGQLRRSRRSGAAPRAQNRLVSPELLERRSLLTATLSPTVLVEGPAAGSDADLLTESVPTATWTATTTTPWLHIAQGSASGTGSSTIDFSFDPNTAAAARSGSITIAGQTLGVTQNGQASSTTLTSSLASSEFGQSVTFTATLAAVAPATGTPTGSVTFEDGATVLGTATLNAAGVATLTTSLLSVGGHSITAVYAGSANFAASTSNAVSQNVSQSATIAGVYLSTIQAVYGESVTFTAAVYSKIPGVGKPTGTVTFFDGTSVLGTSALSAPGQATFTTSSLSYGFHSITAEYGGDTNFTGVTSYAQTQAVGRATIAATLVSGDSSTAYGQSVTFTATLTTLSPGAGTPNGTVTFYDGATPLETVKLNAAGVATLTTSLLSVGSHPIAADYSGSTDFSARNSNAVSQSVAKSATIAGLYLSTIQGVYGQSLTFTAAVYSTYSGAGKPTGTVTFKDGSSTLGTGTLNAAGQTTFTTSSLSYGFHTITAVYAGDPNFIGCTSYSQTQAVTRAATSASLASSASSSTYGQSLTITATLSAVAPGAGAPTGTVTFYDGATALGTGALIAGNATFTTSSLSPGNHSITAVYGGDTNFSASTSSAVALKIAAPLALGATTLLEGPAAGRDSDLLNGPFSTAAWTASTNTSWLHLATDSASGTGSARIDFTFDANTGAAARTGTITIAGMTLSVTQAPAGYISDNEFTGFPQYDAGLLGTPEAVAVDSSGNVYFAPAAYNGIKEWSPATNKLTTLVSSGLNEPFGLAVDGSGNLYIADDGDDAIKEWSPATKQLTTIVSSASSKPYGGYGVAVDGSGNLYIADANDNTIKEWSPVTKQLTMLVSSGLGGFGNPSAVAVDGFGNVYIVDEGPLDNGTIDEWSPATQAITTLVSSANDAFNGLAVDGAGNIYFSDYDHQDTSLIKEWSPSTNMVSTLVSSGLTSAYGVALDGSGNVYIADQFDYAIKEWFAATKTLVRIVPAANGVAVDGSGNVYIADGQDDTITEWSPATNQVTTLVSSGLNSPRGVAVDGSGNLYIADTDDGAIKVWSPATKRLTTLISSGLNYPVAVAVDGFGNVYIADDGAIDEWSPATQKLETLVSSGLGSAFGVAVDGAGNVYIADPDDAAIKEWSSTTHQLTTLVSSGLNYPVGVAVDGSGNVYIADDLYIEEEGAQPDEGIDEWSPSANKLTPLFYGGFFDPVGVAADGSGNVYLTDTGNGETNEFSRAYVGPTTTTVASAAGSGALGILTTAQSLAGPIAVSTDTSWLTLNKVSNNQIDYTYTANMSGYSRTSQIQVSGLRFTITQLGQASTTTLTTSASTVVFGQIVTFTATVAPAGTATGTPTGSVTFYDGAHALGTGELSAGVATFATSSLSVASHSITAVYSYSDYSIFAPSTSSALSETVGQAATTTGLAASLAAPVFGQGVTFTATLAPVSPGAGAPTGTVTFMNGAATLGTGTIVAGQATFTTGALSAGVNAITAVYSGDANFTTSTSSALSQTVGQAATTTSLASSPASPVFGQSVTFNATLAAVSPGAGAPTGVVTFMDGSTVLGTGTLSAGQATFTTGSLGAGGHSITAVYSGDTNFTASTSSALSQAIGQAATTTNLTANIASPSYSESVTFTASLTAQSPGAGTPTGMVTFMDGATTLGAGALNASGVATFTTSSLGAGSHSITAVYGGDPNFISSTSSALSENVSQAAASVLLRTSNSASSTETSRGVTVYGETAIFSATLTAAAPAIGTPTGTVTFMDGSTVLGTGALNAAGLATFSTNSLSVTDNQNVPNHLITAVYGGDANFTGVTSGVLLQTVAQAGETIKVTSSNPSSVVGQSVTFTTTVAAASPGAGIPAGTITFQDGATVLGTVTVNAQGVATLTTSSLGFGPQTIAGIFVGAPNSNNVDDVANFTNGQASVVQTVAADPSATTLVSSANPSTVGQSVTFTATVVAVSPATGTPAGTVTFYDGTTKLDIATLSGGVATFVTSALAAGSHSITADYYGFNYFNTSASNAVLQTVNQSIVAPGSSLATTALVEGPAAGSDSDILSVPNPTSNWTAYTNSSWLHLAPGSASGAGGAVIDFTFDANPNAAMRSGTITISGQTLNVTQAPSTFVAADSLATLVPTVVGSDGAAVDTFGNVYFADPSAAKIYELSAATHTLTAIVTSGLNFPQAVAVDGSGNVYMIDIVNNPLAPAALREWSPATHTLTTLVSSGLIYLEGLAVDRSGNVYIADTRANAIREWSPATQTLTALVSAGLYNPQGVAVDGSGNVYIADTIHNAIEEWSPATQTLTTLVSTGLNEPASVALDGSGNVYIEDRLNNAIKEWSPATKAVTTLVSSGLNQPTGIAVDGSGNVIINDYYNRAIKQWSPATKTVTTLISYSLNAPEGIAVDGSGNVYIADSGDNAIKEWSPATQTLTTLVSTGLHFPDGLAVDASGNVYIADTGNNAIKEWSPTTKTVTTLVSTGLKSPQGIAVDGSGNLYIADSGNNAVKEWSSSTKTVTSLVSSGLKYPVGVAVDYSGNVYIADTNDHAIKEWSPATQNVTTLVSSGLSSPQTVSVDASGNVYIADFGENAVEEWSPSTQTLTTLVSGTFYPVCAAVDASGNVYFGDAQNDFSIQEFARAYVGPSSITVAATAGSGALGILPASQSLPAPFTPTSDSSWLTVGPVVGGQINYSFTANTTGASRTGNITLLGQPFTVTQLG